MYPTKIRLSYSTLELMNTCERKFQMIKLLRGYDDEEQSEHFAFGDGWGAGVTSYLLHGNMDRAIYDAWLAYFPILETDKKSQAILFNTMRMAQAQLDNYRAEYRIAEFNGKPAIELSFRIDINEQFYYVGYIDGVTQHRRDLHYCVLENKHTGMWVNDIDPLYKNSGQALGYSIVLDKIAKQNIGQYALNYLVAQYKKDPFEPTIHILNYKKNLLDRLRWFYSLGVDVDRISQMMKLNIFPMRGGSCLSFNRPCKFFGLCQLQVNDKPKTDKDTEDTNEYQFTYTLDEIVKDHLARVHTGA